MPKPLRTNPAFAHLAYQKAILKRTISYFRRNYLGDELSEPREVLVCEDVFPTDSHTPQEEVQYYLERLNEQVAEIEVELSKFQLVSSTSRGPHEQRNKKGAGERQQKGSPGHGKISRAP